MNQQTKKPQFKRGFKTWAEDKAIEYRLQLNLKSIDPLDAFDLAKHLKVPIYIPSEISNLSSDDLNALSKSSNKWSAVTVPVSEFQNLIIHNPLHAAARQQSNLMHELAHIICGHQADPNKIPVELRGLMRHHDEYQECEANWLGGCLQLPRDALVWALRNRMSMSSIGEHFNASVDMVRYRINITGVKKQVSRYR